MLILVEPRYNEGPRDYENHSSYSVNCQHKFIYEKLYKSSCPNTKHQKIQFNRIATAKDRIPELKIPRMCQNPWLGLIIRLRVPLNELKKIKRRELTCP